MADVVGKTIFSDGKGKLFFGYYKTDDSVQFVDYKTWKKLSFKDVSKGDTNKERVIKAILKNQKQFNKKVEFNMWAKQKKRTFEETMDWFIQNGWINNINKGGIKEGAADVNKAVIPGDVKNKLQKTLDVLNGKKLNYQQKLQVLGRVLDSMGIDKGELNKVSQKLRTKLESVNEAVKPSQVSSTISKVKKELMRKWKQKGGYENFGQKELSQMKDKFDYNPYGSPDERQIAKMLDGFNNWAMNYDGNMREGKKRFNTKYGVGKSKYVVNYHDGKKKHKDGSDFFDIQIFKNQKDFDKFQKDLVSKGFVKESVNESKFGYKQSTASYINKHNNEYKVAERMNKGNEQKFYDDLQSMEDKIGYPKTMKFISNALRGYGVDMFKDPKIKNPADAQEALFLLSK